MGCVDIGDRLGGPAWSDGVGVPASCLTACLRRPSSPVVSPEHSR
jgi:hypothetical protein